MKLKSCLIYILVFALMVWLPASGYAQTKVKVKGVVTSTSGEPLGGVSVTIKDAKGGTVTDSTGAFSITVEKGKILQFDHIGYLPFARGITEAGTVKVTLTQKMNNLDEVVVIGYGTQSRSAITGAVSKLVNKNLDEIPTSRLDNALIGKIAGVTIQNVTSEVGADPVVRIRGFSSISANSSPLVVVDGYPVPDGLSFVNPQDVASVEVLKDAAAAAIYGSRAANGVIIITTKSGAADRPRYNFKVYYGTRKPYKLNPIMTFSEYAEKLYREAAMRANDTTVAANRRNLISDQEQAAYILENQITGAPTNWQELGLQNSNISNAEFSVSGGKKEVKYYLSAGYQKDVGVMKFSDNTRGTMKARLDANLSKKVKLSFNFNPSYIKTNRPTVNYTDYFRTYSFVPLYHTNYTAQFVQQNPQWADILPGDYAQARHFNGLPYSGRMPDGTLWSSNGPVIPWSTSNNTPLSIADREKRYVESYRMLGGVDLSYEIIPRLVFKTALSGYYMQQNDRTFVQSNAEKDGDLNYAIFNDRNYKDVLWENTLNYNKRFGNHNITALVGFTAQQTWKDTSNMVGRNFPTEDFKTMNQAGQIDPALTYTLKDKIGLLSYLGRVTYDYKSKYLVAASFRTDGSSYFAPGHKWGYFPSISGGWAISQEPFFKAVKSVNNLKIRASYGATGNNRIPSFSYMDLLYPANYAFGTGTGSVILGLSPNSNTLANPLITWERTFEFNTGLDLGMFSNRLTLILDWYNRVTDRLLYNQATMSFTGSNQYINNIGKLRNKGVEIELGGVPVQTKNITWSTSVNFTRNKNTLLALGGEPYQYNYGERNEVYAAIVGQPAIQFFGYKTNGVWLSDKEIADAKAAGLTSTLSKYFQAGGLKYVDINGDNAIDANDRVPLGNPFPDFTWGFNNTITYKNFDFSMLIQGSQGGKLINGDLYYNETKKFNKLVNTDQRWVSAMYPGDGKTPYFTNGENWMLTDYVLESASYASLRNLIIGYKFQSKTLKHIGLNGLRIYASGDNLFYIMGKGYRGINPEARVTSGLYNSPLISGYQRGAFPIMRTYTFGIDLSF
ncbi:SusC/RagA family TonB-linked outer membrane protein [Niabella ginsenosidivorans]|uniref:SusC/RagA family TonB-linked outer membrane protein n=1 Tax=Niabella ginsenosidivorans TaxID=1176587 RepID=A0A1A9I875_9BACT|nr:TonB-dependent receptor [Niabella ginsenosidivorans]ANH82881.1 SusC/RagA family TonB-linked outer membrane protein [Niabella ginsenosidivorans]